MTNRVTKDYSIKVFTLHKALFLERELRKLDGIYATYVKHSQHVTDEKYCNLCEETEKKLN